MLSWVSPDRRPDPLAGVTKGRERALAEIGIPPAFADQIAQQAVQGDFAFALRGNQPFQFYDTDHTSYISPKPGIVKAKNSNWGFVQGAIPVDYKHLGKIEKSGNIREMNFKKEFKKPEVLAQIQLNMSLSLIVQGLNATPPEYKLVGDPKQDGILRVKKHVDADANVSEAVKNIIFSVNLNKLAKPEVSKLSRASSMLDAKKLRLSQSHLLVAPSWWDEAKFGSFAVQQNHFYPSMYQTSLDTKPQELKVYGIKNPDGRVATIRPDQDLLWISRASSGAKKENSELHQVVNTFNEDGPEKMMRLLRKHFSMSLEAVVALRHDIAAMGCVTPTEAYQLIQANEQFLKDKDVSYIGKLFQHGAENRNPFLPSDLDGKMLHVWNNEFYVTHNEKELVNFVLYTKDYLAKNIIDIHPGWDMSLWGPVVKKQLELYPDQVSETTRQAYKDSIKVELLASSQSVNLLSKENKEQIDKLIKTNHWEYDANVSAIIIDHKDRIFMSADSIRANGAMMQPRVLDGVKQIVKELGIVDKVCATIPEKGSKPFAALAMPATEQKVELPVNHRPH